MNPRKNVTLLAVVLTFVALLVVGFELSSIVNGQTQKDEKSISIGGMGTMGYVIDSLEPKSPMGQVGMRPGDVIVQMGGHSISTMNEFWMALKEAKDNPLELVYLRYNPNTDKLEPNKVTVKPVLRGDWK